MKSIYKTAEGKNQILSFYKALLTKWTQPSKQYTIETAFGNTFIIECGSNDAPSIILLHGTGSNSAMWIADAKTLSLKYRVFAIDIVGECGKSSENRLHFRSNNYSEWVLEILDKLGLTRVSILGCSLGGWIAIDFTIKNPKKVDKLVLLATAGITQIKPKTIFWIIITSLLGNWGFNKINNMVYGNLKIDKQVLEFASLIKKYYIPRTDMMPVFINKALQQIVAPTLFIGGENDCFYNSQKAASRFSKNLNKAQCYVLENTGHVLINQTERIIQFLNE